MPSEAVRAAGLIFEAAWHSGGGDRLFVDRIAWRLMSEHHALFARAGLGIAELCERLEDEIYGGTTLRHPGGVTAGPAAAPAAALTRASEMGILL